MKYIRIGIIIVFLIVSAAFVLNWRSEKMSIDTAGPEIQFSSKQLEISVHAEEKEYLKDVVAVDEKDGDLTSGVIIESISKFVDKRAHICNITYAVEDSDHNVTKSTRKVKFTDYTSPKFTLSRQLCFEVGSDIGPEDVLGAMDEYEGDISRKVKVLSRTVSTNASGEYIVTAQVTNCLGDTAKIKAPVVIRQSNYLSPTIELKENIVYVKKGTSFHPDTYVKSAQDSNGHTIPVSQVQVVKSSVNMKKAGCYMVQYAIDINALHGEGAYLTVVVED